MVVRSFIEKSNQLISVNDLFKSFQAVAERCGYDRVAFGALSSRSAYPDGAVAPAVALNYPESWVKHYFAKCYQNLDPIVQYTPWLYAPYSWSDLGKRLKLNAAQKRFFAEADEAGLRNGLSVPIHGPNRQCFVVSYAQSLKSIGSQRLDGRPQLMAMQFYWSYVRLIDPDRGRLAVRLSPRQAECLTWSSLGKSCWDIGMILGISENTAAFHLKGAMSRLGTTNRVLAIVKALQLGLIRP